jgi:phosphopantetheinyl transferase
MISVGILDTKGLGHCPSFEFLLAEGERERLEKMNIGKARSLSFFSRLLLMKLYREKIGKDMPEISYTEEGKPYFLDNVCSFSVSHDKDLVVVALSDEGNISVDVQSFCGSEEALKRIEKRFLKDITFNEETLENFDIDVEYFVIDLKKDCVNFKKEREEDIVCKSENDENKDFLIRWTKLEALLKLVGCGFKELKNVNKYLQKVNFKTLFFQHGGQDTALNLAFYENKHF